MSSLFIPNSKFLKQLSLFNNENEHSFELFKLKQRKYSDKTDMSTSLFCYNSNSNTNSFVSRNASPADLSNYNSNRKATKILYKDCSLQLGGNRLTPYQLYKLKSEENRDSLRKKSVLNYLKSSSKILFNTKLTNCNYNQSRIGIGLCCIDSRLKKNIYRKKVMKTNAGKYSNIVDMNSKKKLESPICLKQKIKNRENSTYSNRKVYPCLSVVPIKNYSIIKEQKKKDQDNGKVYLFRKSRLLLPIILKRKDVKCKS